MNAVSSKILKQIKKAEQKGYQKGIQVAVERFQDVSQLVLSDKFGFTPEQCNDFLYWFTFNFNQVISGEITLDEIREVVEEE